MSEQSSVIPHQVHHVANRFMSVVKALVLIVSIAAAVPTAKNLYFAWANDIPFSEVSHRLAQEQLWNKNFDCKIDYRMLVIANGSRLDAGACSKTGDVAIKIRDERGATAYEWIGFEQLRKPAQTASLLDLLIAPAVAMEAAPQISKPEGGLLKRVQAGMEVMCEARQGRTLVRIVKEGDKCYRETVSTLKGLVERRVEVSCNTRC